MSRPLRAAIAGGWYHIASRGHGRQRIFKDLRDHRHFLELAGEMVELHRVEVHAHVLMPNHYHLIIRTWQTVSGRVYSVYSTTNLFSSHWETNMLHMPGDGMIMMFTNGGYSSRQMFFRIGSERD